MAGPDEYVAPFDETDLELLLNRSREASQGFIWVSPTAWAPAVAELLTERRTPRRAA